MSIRSQPKDSDQLLRMGADRDFGGKFRQILFIPCAEAHNACDMKKRGIAHFLTFGFLHLISPIVTAQIIYVDANAGNMSRLDGAVFTPSTTAQVYNDSNWSLRTSAGLASHNTVYEAGGGENVPTLRQTVGAITPGLYDVSTYYWVATNVNWQISSSLGAIQFPIFRGTNQSMGTPVTFTPASTALSYVPAAHLTNGTFASGSAPTQATGGSDRTLIRQYLGKHWVGTSGELVVHIRNGPLISSSAANSRTWYDGLGYEASAGSTSLIGSSWGIGLGTPTISAPTNDSLIWGNNTVNNADNSAVHVSLDSDSTTVQQEPLSLANGQSVKLSGKVQFQTSIIDTTVASQFRWGLFHHNGSTNSAGWTGYWAGNGTAANAGSVFRVNNSSTLYVSGVTAGGSYLSSINNNPPTTNVTAGVHDFSLVITREGNGVKISALMTRESDGAILTDMTATEPTGYTSFTRIGLLSGNTLDVDQINLYQLSLEYPFTPPAPPLPGEIAEVAPNGTWTWFNDERALWHQGKLFAGYVRSDGNPGVTRYDPGTGIAHHVNFGTASSVEVDDHNNPSFTVLPDGRILAVYSKHGSASAFYSRISTSNSPTSLADWSAESIKVTPARNTYANTYALTGNGLGENGTIYNFSRCINYNPCVTLSNDNGVTWGNVTQVINVGTGGTRPYPRYVSNKNNRIDLIYTDGHPRNENNSVYHMYYQSQNFRKTDGSLLKSLANLPIQHGIVSDPNNGEKGSVIYQYDPTWGRGWTWDIHYGVNGHPVCLFQTQRDDVTGTGWNHDRIYYHYARWTGSAWQKTFIAQGGRGIYSAEDDYGGGMAMDPEDPRIIYISSNAANPFSLSDINNVPLGPGERYEIWRGVTLDGGLTFTWSPVTKNSSQDNLRPIVPENHGLSKHLLWLQGTYTSYINYNTKVLGIFDLPKESLAQWQQENSLATLASEDADQDGLADIVEYALGGDPNDSSDRPAPTLSEGAFRFKHLPLRGDVEWIVETSDNLTDWTTVATFRGNDLGHTIAPGIAVTQTDGDVASVALSPMPPRNAAHGFVRLKVRDAPLPR